MTVQPTSASTDRSMIAGRDDRSNATDAPRIVTTVAWCSPLTTRRVPRPLLSATRSMRKGSRDGPTGQAMQIALGGGESASERVRIPLRSHCRAHQSWTASATRRWRRQPSMRGPRRRGRGWKCDAEVRRGLRMRVDANETSGCRVGAQCARFASRSRLRGGRGGGRLDWHAVGLAS